MPTYKGILLRSLGFGAGFGIVFAVLAISWTFYNARPKPPKPWNVTAIVSTGAPSFDAARDGQRMEFTYVLSDKTPFDYRINDASQLKVLIRATDGTLSPPLPSDEISIATPIFIPAGQKTFATIQIRINDIPKKRPDEPDGDYHERLRAYLADHTAAADGLVIFDETNRYQVDLPKWLTKKPT